MKEGYRVPAGKQNRSVIAGAAVAALGLLALTLAAVELYVSVGVMPSGDGGGGILGITTGASAYVVGYGGAGIVLLVLGVWQIYRARLGK